MAEEPTKNLYVIRLGKSDEGKSVLDDRRFMARNPHYRHRILFRKPCVYVGQTALDPEERFRQHKSGYKACRIAKKYGTDLMKKAYRDLNPVPASEAVEQERALALRLRRKGYAVWWN